ncbi:MAG: hypothetical protein RIS56_2631, partial [Verrucomicrobiota bacterium]
STGPGLGNGDVQRLFVVVSATLAAAVMACRRQEEGVVIMGGYAATAQSCWPAVSGIGPL